MRCQTAAPPRCAPSRSLRPALRWWPPVGGCSVTAALGLPWVDDVAREARVTTGALYHHFPTKTALFEAVFVQAHTDLMTSSAKAARGASDGIDELARGFEAFLDGVLQPDMQRILIVEGPRRCSAWPARASWMSAMPTRRSCTH